MKELIRENVGYPIKIDYEESIGDMITILENMEIAGAERVNIKITDDFIFDYELQGIKLISDEKIS